MDARKIREENNGNGPNPIIYAIFTIILWIIIVPLYLYNRRQYASVVIKSTDIPKPNFFKIDSEDAHVNPDEKLIEIFSNSRFILTLFRESLENLYQKKFPETRDSAQHLIDRANFDFNTVNSLTTFQYQKEKVIFLESMNRFLDFGRALRSTAYYVENHDPNLAIQYAKQAESAGNTANQLILKVLDSFKQKKTTIPHSEEFHLNNISIKIESNAKRDVSTNNKLTTPTNLGQNSSTHRSEEIRQKSGNISDSRKNAIENKSATQQGITWAGNTSEIRIKNYLILNPLIYWTSYQIENCEASCINLNLPIGKPISEPKGSLGYWPKYATISPDQRANYLLWLSTGRYSDIEDIGYVFLFFYGLEYRALIEKKDIPIIIDEVNSLLKIFTSSGSFNSYLSSFLAYIAAQNLESISENNFSNFFPNPIELSYDQVLVALSWHIKQNKPIFWEIAYSLANTIPETPKSVITQKLSQQFKKLFETKFKAKFPEGLRLEPSLRNYKLEYRPASPSLLPHYQNYSLGNRIEAVEISNPLGKKSQFSDVFSIWIESIEELKPASRKVGKGDQELTAQAYQALPDSLKIGLDHPDKPLWDHIITQSEHEEEAIIVPASSLATLIQVEKRERLTPTQSKLLFSTARDVGYILIPDPRITGTPYRWADSIAIYPLPDKKTFTSEAYPTVAFILELGMSVALVDDRFSPEEQDHLDRFIFGSFELTPFDIECLKQYQHILIQNPPSLERLGTRLKEHLTEDNKLVVAEFIRDMATADGVLEQSEYKALSKIFKGMGLTKDQTQTLFPSQLIKQPAEQPILVAQSTSTRDGESIVQPVHLEPCFTLNPEILDEKLRRTQEIQKILDGVIRSDDDEGMIHSEQTESMIVSSPIPENLSSPLKRESSEITYAGLHTKYYQFLKDVLMQNEFTKSELQSISRRYGVMMGGAIEDINSWSDENYGDTLFDDTDENRILINSEIKGKIQENI